MNLVQINRERGERPGALHNLEAELAGGDGPPQMNFKLHCASADEFQAALCERAVFYQANGRKLVGILKMFGGIFPITHLASRNK